MRTNDKHIRCYHSGPQWTRERWQWRGAPRFPKLQHLWNLTIRLFSVIYQDTRLVGWLTPQQRSSRCILQPQPAGQQIKVALDTSCDDPKVRKVRIYIYIYIERERERERKWNKNIQIVKIRRDAYGDIRIISIWRNVFEYIHKKSQGGYIRDLTLIFIFLKSRISHFFNAINFI